MSRSLRYALVFCTVGTLLFVVESGMAQCSNPRAVLLINNAGVVLPNYFSVCRYGPMVVTGSRSTCAGNYFLSIELSDRAGNRLGGEFGEWLDRETYDAFGHISAFNLKAWAEAHHFHFTPGQFYRVKLAIDPGWHETTGLIYIEPAFVSFVINNKVAPVVDVAGPLYQIILRARFNCANGFLLSIEDSDQSGSRNGYKIRARLDHLDYQRFGNITGFDVTRWARSRGVRLSPSRYYRISLQTGTPTTEAAVLIHLL